MKVSRQPIKHFEPVLITLETEEELKKFQQVLKNLKVHSSKGFLSELYARIVEEIK